MAKYALGLDFGTLSVRGVLVDAQNGEIAATAVREYPHGVMEEGLPQGWALQHPQDYLDGMREVVREMLEGSGIAAEAVIGIGVDFTNCTVLPVCEDGTPLCFLEKYREEKHAYVKLWKQHAAQEQAQRVTEALEKRNAPVLAKRGGKCSAEWLLPKALHTLEDAPEVYRDAAHIVEAGDWVVMRLTGELTRSACYAGYKTLWEDGYPPKEVWAELHPEFENVVEEKLRGEVLPIGGCAGRLTREAAEWLGLREGTAVAVPMSDAHVAAVSAGVTQPGALLMILGTSTVHLALGEEEQLVPGTCGVMRGGMIPGLYAFEAGQCCCGDHFDWFVKNGVPAAYEREARARGMNLHALLTEKAERLAVGESGLLALDWWNGNRSVLIDAELSGMLLGLTLRTKPEEIYRALIEATAYGTRRILEQFETHGVRVERIVACGGIARKNPMLMRIYADVTKRRIDVVDCAQTSAVGAAIFGAAAAGEEGGGYADVFAASAAMRCAIGAEYLPDAGNAAAYDKLYAEYKTLHDYFGCGGNDVMKRLRKREGL